MIAQLTQNTIDESLQPIIIKAFATWCPHCTKMKPIFEQLEKTLGQKYIFAEFDIDEFSQFTQEFTIESLPTFIFIKNKEEVGREIGEMPQDELSQAIKKYLGN